MLQTCLVVRCSNGHKELAHPNSSHVMQVADDESDRVQQISIRRCEGTKRSLQHQKVKKQKMVSMKKTMLE
ncbi:hypothetical protein C1H46_013555 [Malus baccata]|uniref:Uncharacterized protein n=1 Tax=Malus baccata TaxID=106549 RepID=A0A540MQ02_MALBA|nr:hypothetical protein C1H46_013555 [Malus baccata]